jgi:hypothetical protein
MILDCLARVIRAGRIKTAPAAEQRAHGDLVQTQQRNQYRLHGDGAARAASYENQQRVLDKTR